MNVTHTFSCQTDLTVIHGLAGGAQLYEKLNCQQAQKTLNRAMCRVMGSSTIQPKEDIHHGKS